MKSKTLSVFIQAPLQKVYAYAAQPQNLTCWVPGFFKSVEPKGDDWCVETPLGQATLRFAEPNPFGVLDHWVTLNSGESFYNPMRLIAHGKGCALQFTLFQQAGMSDADFAKDAALVRADLDTLRQKMEEAASI